jgi:hypothetical protein
MSIKNKTKKSTASGILALGFAAAALPFTITSADANGNTTETVTDSETVTLKADIPKLCKFESTFNSGNIDIPLLPDSGRPNFMEWVNASASITCNTVADVELESAYGGMVHDGIHIDGNPDNLGSDYLTSFDYAATLSHGGDDLATLDTANGPINAALSSDPQEGFTSGNVPHDETLNLRIKPENVSGVLQAGKYRDNLTVKLIPK